jgi:alkylhydroperoxidase family enzyme
MRPVLAERCVKSHRETAARYAVRDADQAAAFRWRLDARLEQRQRGAVSWSPPGATPPPA